jgi:Flp pilus assembly pilin Flp
MFQNLLMQFWRDESGVIATEYLMLSSIVAVGSATGLAAMRDSITEEYKDFGQEVRETRQSFARPGLRTQTGNVGGAVATNPIGTPYTNPVGTPYTNPNGNPNANPIGSSYTNGAPTPAPIQVGSLSFTSP